ncbi:unknown protein [Seminavis robusta]|uniref:DDE Tnp4 domain-containing protein n=1 Tax=Seminavis robusta TaxID=568900 RepID=A0A9N8HBP7_9STRA|nr:unknown protein [Seminavis robusta]|eukprot:Sro347_g122930.1 n/a (396) ;mRNA; f:30705-31892
MEGNDFWERRRRFLLLSGALELHQSSFVSNLTEEGRQRRQRSLPRPALLFPADSPWQRLYSSGNNQALITTTGFDHRAFHELLKYFEPWFNSHSPWTGSQDGTTCRRLKRRGRAGRRRIIDAPKCLGLVLTWYRFRGGEYILQGWFGFTGTHANVWLRFGRRGLLCVLGNQPFCKVQIPEDAKIQQLSNAIEAKHPLLKNVFCVADGLKLTFQQCEDLDEQSMYYNGWTHDHYITNLFVFSIDGFIILYVINAPGSMHDSTLAEYGGVYDKLHEVFERTGGKCCVDSAFTTMSNPFLIKSSQNITTATDAMDLLIHEQATSLRQSAEWGMRAMQSAFPRLKDRIHYEENGERMVVLQLLTLLYNARISLVGLNQLQNTYVPSWSVDAAFYIQEQE